MNKYQAYEYSNAINNKKNKTRIDECKKELENVYESIKYSNGKYSTIVNNLSDMAISELVSDGYYVKQLTKKHSYYSIEYLISWELEKEAKFEKYTFKDGVKNYISHRSFGELLQEGIIVCVMLYLAYLILRILIK